MSTWEEGFEDGLDGVVLSTSNTSFDATTGSAADGQITFSDSKSHIGDLSALMSVVSEEPEYQVQKNLPRFYEPDGGDDVFVRFYMYLPTGSELNEKSEARFLILSTTERLWIEPSSEGPALAVRHGGLSSRELIPLGRWIRVEWCAHYAGDDGYGECRLYTTDPDADEGNYDTLFNTNPSSKAQGTDSLSLSTKVYDDLGKISFYIDALAFSDEDWIGPFIDNAPGTAHGSAVGNLAWGGLATGTTPTVPSKNGFVTSSLEWTGSAYGESPPVPTTTGIAIGTLDWSHTATGTVAPTGAATGTLAWDGAALGGARTRGRVDTTITWSTNALGSVHASGNASTTVDWNGTATGSIKPSGSATATIAWDGAAIGHLVATGAATSSLEWSGSAQGDNTLRRDITVTASPVETRWQVMDIAGNPIIAGEITRSKWETGNVYIQQEA